MSQKLRITNILDRDFRGWLPVIDRKGNKFELFYTTQVETNRNSKYFTVLEGFNKDKEVAINKQSLPHTLYTKYANPLEVADSCSLVLDLAESEIIYVKNGKLFQTLIQANNLTPGEYLILLPDRRRSDKIVEDYISEKNGGSRFAETWFPLVKDKFEFQYLHYGSYSNGCATVLSGEGWTNLYLYIMSSRMHGSENKIHGRLIVVEDLNKVSTNPSS